MDWLEKCLHGPVSNWSADQFEQISMPTSFFPKLPANIVNDLSTDQYYACRICWAIVNEVVEDDLLYLEVRPVHSRWLTLGCRILCYYISLDKPSPILKVLVYFWLTVYFPTWFDIK